MTKKVYIGNLPFETTEQKVHDLFAPYGSIDSITMIRDRETNRFRGFCFVEMKAAADADAAIAGLKGTEVEGRKVKVNEARSRKGKGKEKKSAPKAQAEKKSRNKDKDSEEARRRALHGRTQRGGFGIAPAHTTEDGDDPDALHNRTERGSFGADGERVGGNGGRSGGRRRSSGRGKSSKPVDPDFPFSGGIRRSG